jgi:hypothetical protein
MPPSLPVSPEIDSNTGFLADSHGEKWLEDHVATIRDINGPYNY